MCSRSPRTRRAEPARAQRVSYAHCCVCARSGARRGLLLVPGRSCCSAMTTRPRTGRQGDRPGPPFALTCAAPSTTPLRAAERVSSWARELLRCARGSAVCCSYCALFLALATGCASPELESAEKEMTLPLAAMLLDPPGHQELGESRSLRLPHRRFDPGDWCAQAASSIEALVTDTARSGRRASRREPAGLVAEGRRFSDVSRPDSECPAKPPGFAVTSGRPPRGSRRTTARGPITRRRPEPSRRTGRLPGPESRPRRKSLRAVQDAPRVRTSLGLGDTYRIPGATIGPASSPRRS